MNGRQDPAYAEKDRLMEQIMIEQLKRTHFPAVSEWNPESIAAEGDGVPALDWESFRHFISEASGTQIPRDAEVIVTRHPGHSSTEHCHDHYEACFILSGGCTGIVNHHLEFLKEGDLCLIPPSASHDYTFRPDTLALCFSVHPAIFGGVCSPLLEGSSAVSLFLLDSLYNENHEQYLLFRTGNDKMLRLMALTMFQLMLEPEQSTGQVLNSLLLPLFARLAAHPHTRVQSVPPKSRLLDLDLLNIIRQNYATITLADLAKHLHYTVPHCSKYLKEHLGCTFSELVRRIRFQAAEDYLLHSDMSVNQISETLGYENPENFIRAFKKYFGVTPARYRQTNR